jgi:hypothetical protein
LRHIVYGLKARSGENVAGNPGGNRQSRKREAGRERFARQPFFSAGRESSDHHDQRIHNHDHGNLLELRSARSQRTFLRGVRQDPAAFA